MGFPWTLQKYIFREMGKSFVLTALSLTAVLGLGGGVLEMVDLGEITPGQLMRLMLLMLPVAAALTLPMAALFSAASIYGRLSADNEFVACRSSGINLLVLFMPALVLSLVSASVTFLFSNFVIPGMVRNIENFLSDDISALVKQRLNRPRGITLGGRFRIYADENAVDVAEENEVILRGVVFVEVDGDEWVRYGTAREVRLVFDRTEDPAFGSRLRVRGRMVGLSSYDRKDKQFYEEGERVLSSDNIPQQMPLQLKFLTLTELLHYWRQPEDWREVRERMESLRVTLAQGMIFEHFWKDWRDGKQVILADEQTRITVTSQSGALIPGNAGIELYDVDIQQERRNVIVHAVAERAIIDTTRSDSTNGAGVILEVYDVRLTDGGESVARKKDMFGPVAAPASIIAKVEALSADELLAQTKDVDQPRLRDRHADAAGVTSKTIRRIVATMNERFAFGISVVVLVILGAALGIIFRGSHVMVAFGISFVPSLLILVGIVMGKQMTYNEPTYALGLAVLWSGIVLVAAIDCWTLLRVLRR